MSIFPSSFLDEERNLKFCMRLRNNKNNVKREVIDSGENDFKMEDFYRHTCNVAPDRLTCYMLVHEISREATLRYIPCNFQLFFSHCILHNDERAASIYDKWYFYIPSLYTVLHAPKSGRASPNLSPRIKVISHN